MFPDVVCTDLRNIVGRSKVGRNQRLIQDIIDFIDCNYSSSSMSLSMAAAQFGVTEPYLSYLFKQQTGENFFVYIENRRLKKGCEYLDEKDLTVEQIAEQVGYTSSHSFRRAFKKKYGITPTVYCENKS